MLVANAAQGAGLLPWCRRAACTFYLALTRVPEWSKHKRDEVVPILRQGEHTVVSADAAAALVKSKADRRRHDRRRSTGAVYTPNCTMMTATLSRKPTTLSHPLQIAGTYIKEFVHGDLGRTVPSVGSLLGCRADILQLDVTHVEDTWSKR